MTTPPAANAPRIPNTSPRMSALCPTNFQPSPIDLSSDSGDSSVPSAAASR
jgi:hypothetical protein